MDGFGFKLFRNAVKGIIGKVFWIAILKPPKKPYQLVPQHNVLFRCYSTVRVQACEKAGEPFP
jgi:hypothetical protein